MVQKAIFKDAKEIAILHKENINKGFISSLGIDFLTILYQYLIKDEIVITYKNDNKVVGFISASFKTSGMMKNFIKKNFFKVTPTIIKNIKIKFIKKIFQTILEPKKVKSTIKMELPELLSIVVDKNYRGSKTAKQLLNSLEENLKQNGFEQYMVMAGEELIPANKFYIKNNFTIKTKVEIHDKKLSNIYIKKL